MHPPETLLHRLLICAASLLLAALPGDASDAKPKSKPESASATKTETPVPLEPSASTGLTAFGRQIPAQRPNRGVYIPSFSEGKASSIVEADVLTRIDDSRLQAEAMTIHLYGQAPKDNVTVTMPSATYNMTNQILRSNQRSKVSRADFDLEGDALIFDTTTSQGRMSGNVRMTIHDAGSFLNKPKTDTKKPTPPVATDSPSKAAPLTPPPANKPSPPAKAKPQS